MSLLWITVSEFYAHSLLLGHAIRVFPLHQFQLSLQHNFQFRHPLPFLLQPFHRVLSKHPHLQILLSRPPNSARTRSALSQWLSNRVALVARALKNWLPNALLAVLPFLLHVPLLLHCVRLRRPSLAPRIPHLHLQILHLRARRQPVPIFRHNVAISSPRNFGLAFFLPLCLSFRPLLRHLLPLPYFPLFLSVFIHRLVGRSFFSTNACSTWHSVSRLRGFQ